MTKIAKNTTADVIAGLLFVFGILGMLLTAWQLLDNPDGLCASFCRLMVKCVKFFLRIVCLPCTICCQGSQGRYANANNPADNAVFMETENYISDLEMT